MKEFETSYSIKNDIGFKKKPNFYFFINDFNFRD